MDGDEGCRGRRAKKTLRLLGLVSFFSLLYFTSYNNIHFSAFIFSLFAHAMDRKYMFLICNAIIAFLANNLTLSSSTGFLKTAQDSVKQIGQTPPAIIQENAASVEYGIGEEEMDTQQECGYRADDDEPEPEPEEDEEEQIQAVSEGDDDEPEPEPEEDEEEQVEENKGEEVSDASVSTEELNHKFEEFIRKMKEEIRIEAQQHLIAV